MRNAVVLAVALVLPLVAGAEDWATVSSGALTIRTRNVAGSAVREVWVEGRIAANVPELQETLLDGESFPRFMPYMREARRVGGVDADGSWFVYNRVAPPVISPRDYVVRVTLVQSVAADGSGEFKNAWRTVDGLVPANGEHVRLPVNEGTWHVRPDGDGYSRVTYRFRIDPGGWVPSWLADTANQSGIQDVWKAVEKEARRRAALKRGPQP